MTNQQEKIQNLQSLQITMSEHLPILDPEERNSTLGAAKIKEAISKIGEAITEIICSDIDQT